MDIEVYNLDRLDSMYVEGSRMRSENMVIKIYYDGVIKEFNLLEWNRMRESERDEIFSHALHKPGEKFTNDDMALEWISNEDKRYMNYVSTCGNIILSLSKYSMPMRLSKWHRHPESTKNTIYSKYFDVIKSGMIVRLEGI